MEENQTKPNRLPKSLTTVTMFSKLLAMVLFITLPFVGFYLGFSYNQALTSSASQTLTVPNIQQPTPIPTQTIDTSSWKTYTSSSYGFSFKYPNQYEDVIGEKPWGISVGCHCEAFNWFDVETVSTTLEPPDWWKTNGKTFFNGNVGLNGKYHLEAYKSQVSQDTVNGIKYFKIDAETPVPTIAPSPHPNAPIASQKYEIYLLKNGNRVLVITNYILGATDYTLPFGQILSTFKFTN